MADAKDEAGRGAAEQAKPVDTSQADYGSAGEQAEEDADGVDKSNQKG